MSARAATPTVWPLAEAMIRHKVGSDDQGDGSHGPFINQAVGVVARTHHAGEEREFLIMETTNYVIVLWRHGTEVERAISRGHTPKSAFMRSTLASKNPEACANWDYVDNPDGSARLTGPTEGAGVYFSIDPDFSSDPDYARSGGPEASTSLLSIDVGFDPRVTHQLVRLTRWRHGVRYHPEPGSCMEAAECHAQDVEAMAETLAKAGYSVVIAQTTNGRDVQCTPQELAPDGDRPGYEWTGPAWAVQAKTDNYWCVGPSLLAVLSRSGWEPGDVTELMDDTIRADRFVYRAIDRQTAEWIGNAASVAGGYVAIEGPRLFVHSLSADPDFDAVDCRLGFLNGDLLVMVVPSTAGLANEGRPIPDRVLAILLPELAAAGYSVEEGGSS